jgi:tetratricopeptide (TPR) repeat protein
METSWMRPVGLLTLLAATVPVSVCAQTEAADMARGKAARSALDMPAALAAYTAAIAADSSNATACWKAALTLIDMGKLTPDSVPNPERDSLYARAEVLAQRAVVLAPKSADAYFILATAIGRAALTKSRKERVRRAGEVQQDALTAIGLDQSHDGAYHVLGRWNAEIMRLSGMERFVAKSFMGGSALGQASWHNAQMFLQRAVTLNPTWIYHRLDLGLVYVDVGNYAAAREQFEVIATLPIADVGDPMYKRDAAAMLTRIADRK